MQFYIIFFTKKYASMVKYFIITTTITLGDLWFTFSILKCPEKKFEQHKIKKKKKL